MMNLRQVARPLFAAATEASAPATVEAEKVGRIGFVLLGVFLLLMIISVALFTKGDIGAAKIVNLAAWLSLATAIVLILASRLM